jgi:acyl-CoA thioesterase-1
MLGVHLLAGACSTEAPAVNAIENSNSTVNVAQTEPQEEGKLVLAFGDSLYAGYGLTPQQSFPAQLEKSLRDKGIAATVHNAGVSGDTSAAGLARLRFTLDGPPRTPDLALVGLGANDMLRGLDPVATERNLLAICKELQGRGIPIVMTGMLAAPNLGADYARRFNGLFPKVAKQCDAKLYPFFLADVITNRALMLPDRVHPNGTGIERIVTQIAPLIAGELQASR